ncbi:hypothetical protein AAG906_011005 [Vitis piasezkii]
MRISDRVSLRSPHFLPEPLRTTSSPSDLHHAGNLFRRPIFRNDHIFQNARLIYTPWKPHRNRHITPPCAALLLRTVTHAPARDGAWLTFRPLPTPLQARPAPSWPSSPPAVLPEPCISIFSLFLAFLPFRPPPTGLPLHLRGLGAASLPLQGSLRSKYDMRITWLPEARYPEVDRVRWSKIDAQLCSDYTRMISSVFIRWLLLLSISFFMVLTLIGLRPDLEPIRDQILGSSSVPSLDDVFARLLLVPEVEANVLIAPIAINLATLAIVAISYMEDLLALPIWPSPLILRCLSLRAPPHLRHLRLLLPLLPRSFLLYYYYLDLPTITLANGSQTWLKVLTGVREAIGIGRESQGLYHLTSDSSPAVCIYTDAPLLIHNRLGHPSLSKFRRWFLVFHFVASVDNAKEYFLPNLLRLCLIMGFVIVFLCSYSSTKWACTLLLHSHIPFHFGDVVLTACYLINRMPSSVLHDRFLTPFSSRPTTLFPSSSSIITFFEDSPFFSTTSESLPVSEVLPIPIVSPPDAMPPRPLQVYHRRPHVVAPLPFPEAPADSLPIPSASPAPALPSPNDLPIAVRKAPMKLFPIQWRAMVDEMVLCTLMALGILLFYPRKSTVGCRWVYALRLVPDGLYMEQPPGFVAQGESGLVCRLRRSLYGLKQSPRAWFSRFSSVVQEFGMLRSTADHSVFYHHNSLGQCIYLVVYVDDIVITGSDQDGIQKLKQHLFTHFQTKDLGKLKYFLGIEIAQSSFGVVLSQRKYALDILEETGMLDCKPVDTPMDPNVKLVPGQGEPLGDPGRYRRLVGKLNYLTITRPDISFLVSVVSQFLQSPCDSHWDAVIRILRYIKSTPGQGVLYENRGHTQVVGYTDADWAGSPTDRRSTSGYCVFIGGNLISWNSKKQDVVVDLALKPSIELWLWQHVNSYG